MAACLLWLCCVAASSRAQSVEAVRLMCYNLLNYPDGTNLSADTTLRNPLYRSIVSAADPDILVIAELSSLSGYNGFLSHVMNANGTVYGAATYINSPDTDRGLFYKTSKFQFVSNTPIPTGLRDINEFKLVHLASGDTLRVYAVHLKASTGVSNEQQRSSEVDSLRKRTNALPPGSHFVVCGDFNIYGNGETAYQKLLQPQAGTEGELYDALNLSGIWNNPSYAAYHTQSPRVRAFGGGATGGMDDRFDMILFSKAVRDSGGVFAVPGSLTAFGNDGNHYNDSINRQPNTAVPIAVANALHNASDHLPVLLTLNFTNPGGALPDVGVSAFVQPTSSCPQQAVTLKVRVKNFGGLPLQLGSTPVTVQLKSTAPDGSITLFSAVLNAGVIQANTDILVAFSPTYPMVQGGLYTFNTYTSMNTGDADASNDTLPTAFFSITGGIAPVLSPQGPVQLCNGSSVTLQVSGGVAWQWSNGVQTSSQTVSTAGSYSVNVTSASGCTSSLGPVEVIVASPQLTDTVFFESMGTVSTTTSIAAHETANGFLNDDLLMSGTGDIRNTQASAGYAGASGGANVFLASTAGRSFTIGNIQTVGASQLVLRFAVYKSSSVATGADLKVQVSTDGIVYTDLLFPALPTGLTGWYYRTATGQIPAAANLRIRFLNSTSASQYRIDDVLLTGTAVPTITALADTVLCPGNNVQLAASAGSTYLWSTGATTSSITANAPGDYVVTVDCNPSEPFTVHTCAAPVLQMELLLEGAYLGTQQLRPTLYENGVSSNPFASDSVRIELRAATAPFEVEFQTVSVMDIDGHLECVLPVALINASYYVVLRHRSSLETWSKWPVFISPSGAVLDFKNP